MIDLSFSWAWIPAIILVIAGIVVFYSMAKESGDYGIGEMFGCMGFIICVLIALVWLGIFVW